MIWRDGLPVKMGRHYKVLLKDHLKREIDREPILGMLHHMGCCGLDLEETVFHQGLDGDALPNRVELAPARHTVDIHLDPGARQLVELIPGPAFFLLHFSPDTEVPRG